LRRATAILIGLGKKLGIVGRLIGARLDQRDLESLGTRDADPRGAKGDAEDHNHVYQNGNEQRETETVGGGDIVVVSVDAHR